MAGLMLRKIFKNDLLLIWKGRNRQGPGHGWIREFFHDFLPWRRHENSCLFLDEDFSINLGDSWWGHPRMGALPAACPDVTAVQFAVGRYEGALGDVAGRDPQVPRIPKVQPVQADSGRAGVPAGWVPTWPSRLPSPSSDERLPRGASLVEREGKAFPRYISHLLGHVPEPLVGQRKSRGRSRASRGTGTAATALSEVPAAGG